MPDPIATLYGYELHHNGHHYGIKTPDNAQDARVVVSLANQVEVPTTAFSNRDPHHVAEYADKLATACAVANYFQAVINDRANN